MKFLIPIFLIFFCATYAQAIDCAKLIPIECMRSSKCSLDCKRSIKDKSRCIDKKSYFCRDEANECEKALNQTNFTKAQCESNKKCVYDPGTCFCRCDFDTKCLCECGSGAPPNCVLKNKPY